MHRIALIAALVSAIGCRSNVKVTVKPGKVAKKLLEKKQAQPGDIVAAGPNIGVSNDLVDQCMVRLSDVTKTPKFDYDEFSLEQLDREVLDAVGKCVMKDGPLAGRSIQLVGRADTRGTQEYNLALGDKRAHAVSAYLVRVGVDKDQIATTSRGDLDATGRDEISYRNDRRVDVQLMEDLKLKEKVSTR
jgi:outer membrane protein OmpA-like peptidoglycan-associated protein